MFFSEILVIKSNFFLEKETKSDPCETLIDFEFVRRKQGETLGFSQKGPMSFIVAHKCICIFSFYQERMLVDYIVYWKKNLNLIFVGS